MPARSILRLVAVSTPSIPSFLLCINEVVFANAATFEARRIEKTLNQPWHRGPWCSSLGYVPDRVCKILQAVSPAQSRTHLPCSIPMPDCNVFGTTGIEHAVGVSPEGPEWPHLQPFCPGPKLGETVHRHGVMLRRYGGLVGCMRDSASMSLARLESTRVLVNGVNGGGE